MRAAVLLLVAALVVGGGAAAWRAVAFGALSALETAPAPADPLSALPERLGEAGRPLRLAVLGTSLSHRGDWPDRLAAGLAACREAGAGIRRVARPGASIRWGEGALGAALEGPPDLLLMEFAINDASLAHGASVAGAAARLSAMLERAAAAGVPVLLMSMNPAWGRERWERPGHAAYLALYAQAAAAGRAGFLDTIPAWRALPAGRFAALVPDGLHPSPEAMAEVQLPALLAALRPRVCDPGRG